MTPAEQIRLIDRCRRLMLALQDAIDVEEIGWEGEPDGEPSWMIQAREALAGEPQPDQSE